MRSLILQLAAALVTSTCFVGLSLASAAAQDTSAKAVLAPAESTPATDAIRQKMADPVTLEFVETPIGDVIDFLKDYTGVNIVVDKRAWEEEGLTTDTPVSIHVQSIKLDSALRLLLRVYNLTWLIENDVLLLTSESEAGKHVVPRAYAVADLSKTPDDGEHLVRIVQQVIDPTGRLRDTAGDRVQFISTPATVILMGNDTQHDRVSRLLDELRGRNEQGPETVKLIRAKLKDAVTLEFVETPLSDVFDFLKDYTGANIILDKPALEEEGINSDTPVTIHVQSIPLNSALGILLGQYDLTWRIDSECLVITSKLQHDNMPSLHVYPVAKMLGERAKVSGEEWVRLITGMTEIEWQGRTSAKHRLEVGAKVVVRHAMGSLPATIREVKKNQYKVHFESAGGLEDEWVCPDRIGVPPAKLADTGPFIVDYYEPTGSLVVLVPDSLQKSIENLIGLMVKSSTVGK